MKIYKIYCLKTPKGVIKYIGCTTAELKARLSQHIYDGKTRNSIKSKWIKELLEKNKKPIIELITNCTEDNWMKKEQFYIKKYCLSNLTNHTKGGDGIVFNRTQHSIKRSSDAKNVSIVQLNTKGEYLTKYNSLKEASVKFNVGNTCINNALNGRSKTACGFIWVYEKNYDKTKDYSLKNRCFKIEVKVTNLLTGKIEIYSSMKEVERSFKIGETVIRGLLHSYKEYKNCKFERLKEN